jgi:Holliday junction resolvasome RuvABC endonuclease subunit
MTIQLGLGGNLTPPRSLTNTRPIMGIDPSTKRVAAACVQNGTIRWATRSLPVRKGDEAQRWAAAYETCSSFFKELAGEWGRPVGVAVERPFGAHVPAQSQWALGVILAALGPWVGGPVVLANSKTWKRVSLGDGHGNASKDEVMAWAQSAGYDGALQDEADAIGIATAHAVELARL